MGFVGDIVTNVPLKCSVIQQSPKNVGVEVCRIPSQEVTRGLELQPRLESSENSPQLFKQRNVQEYKKDEENELGDVEEDPSDADSCNNRGNTKYSLAASDE